MDQRDLSRWLTTMLKHGRPGHAYNLGSDKEILIRDLAFLVRDTLAPSKRVRIAGVLKTQNIRNRYIPSIEKARIELQLDLNYSLEQSILSAVKDKQYN